MTKPIITVDSLSKAYRLGLKEEIPDTLVTAVTGTLKAPFRNWKKLQSLDTKDGGEAEDILWALRDVSFDVQEGEVVGIIGRNGAGKSTLLKVLSRITEPTSGCVKLRGRVSSLLEVGTGFHPELTGRDNVYMNGTILGMTKAEIDAKFDEIVDFSGVEKFLDTPVKRYSSGMKVRLAFAVAAHLEPEILIIDEVLAVGDFEFQKKCLGKMQDVATTGRTVLFVSHNMAAVQGLCSRAITLSNGEMAFDGPAKDGIQHYLSAQNGTGYSSAVGQHNLQNRVNTYGEGEIIIRHLTMLNEHGDPSDTFFSSRPMVFEIAVEGINKYKNSQIGLIIKTHLGDWIANFNSGMKPPSIGHRKSSETVRLDLHRIPLVPGRYTLDIAVAEKAIGRLDYVESAAELQVESFDIYNSGYSITANDGVTYLEGDWSIN